MYRKQVRRRRAVLVLLVVVSLILVSATFSQSDSGPLHAVQQGVATALGPVEEGASRALKPARDLVNWFDETFQARGENSTLQADNQHLRKLVAKYESAAGENAQFKKLLGLDGKPPVSEYQPVTTRVIGRSPTVWYSTVTVDRGSSSGIADNDPVITGDGLVGRVTDTTRGTSLVRLITDHRSAVSARVLPNGPQGVVEPQAGDPSTMLLDDVFPDQKVKAGQMLVTAGWSNGVISSAFPAGIEIGKVTKATTGEGQTFQEIDVKPFADLRNLDYVQVLTGGPARPGVGG
jgi:rod shape-determining protein MreC